MLQKLPLLLFLTLYLASSVGAGSSLRGLAQRLPNRKPDPQAQLLQYYRQYPARYIRISKESYAYLQQMRVAYHSFTLTNLAGVSYSEIEVQFSYRNRKGESVANQALQVQGVLKPYGTLEVKRMRVKGVPPACENVVLAVSKAVIYR